MFDKSNKHTFPWLFLAVQYAQFPDSSFCAMMLFSLSTHLLKLISVLTTNQNIVNHRILPIPLQTSTIFHVNLDCVQAVHFSPFGILNKG